MKQHMHENVRRTHATRVNKRDAKYLQRMFSVVPALLPKLPEQHDPQEFIQHAQGASVD